MKRFSKIVSRMREVPLASVISAMNWACRSVGKPGNGSVVTSTAAMPAPLRRMRMPSLVGITSAPAAASTSSAAWSSSGRVFCKQHVAAGHGDRHGVGAGLDAVGQHVVGGAGEPGHALDLDARGAGAGDARAHLDEAIGEIGDLRLARRILDDGRAAGRGSRP